MITVHTNYPNREVKITAGQSHFVDPNGQLSILNQGGSVVAVFNKDDWASVYSVPVEETRYKDDDPISSINGHNDLEDRVKKLEKTVDELDNILADLIYQGYI